MLWLPDNPNAELPHFDTKGKDRKILVIFWKNIGSIIWLYSQRD